MTGFISLAPREQRHPHKRQIANQIQSLVPAELIRKTQRTIHNSTLRQDDGIFERASTDQPHSSEWLNIPLKAKGSRTSQQSSKTFRVDLHLKLLPANQRMRKIYITTHVKVVGRINSDPAVAFDDFQWLQNLQETPATTQSP